MTDVVALHLGQAGVQIGAAVWELYCHEHGISPEGKLLNDTDHLSIGAQAFFRHKSSAKYSARAIFVDLEPSVIDDLRKGVHRNLYERSAFVAGSDGAANNYARGYYTVGSNLIPKANDAIRDALEASDNSQGFIIFRSCSGGTGSGFNTLLFEHLENEHPKKDTIEIVVFPSRKLSTAVVEPYNAILSSHGTMNMSRCVISVDNEAMFTMCSRQLDITQPTYKNLNNVLGQAVSAVTAGQRFESNLKTNVFDFQTNLVPFPRLHFPVMSIAPIIGDSTNGIWHRNVGDITFRCFEPPHRLSTGCGDESYVSCCALYRGDVTPKDINEAVAAIKTRKYINFVNWCPTGFKIGLSSEPPKAVVGGKIVPEERSLCMVYNNLGFRQTWINLIRKYRAMLDKFAFLHWYINEGMEAEEFVTAGNDILTLIKDYEEITE